MIIWTGLKFGKANGQISARNSSVQKSSFTKKKEIFQHKAKERKEKKSKREENEKEKYQKKRKLSNVSSYIIVHRYWLRPIN